jgi:hypothetical protein
MESLDYRYFPISINKHTAIPAPDGSVQIVVSKTNPGLPNWIDTCNHKEGTMCLRWYRLKEEIKTTAPDCSVVKISNLSVN